MPVEEAPEDDEVRQSYNFAPGYRGLVYRADVPDYGAGARRHKHGDEGQDNEEAHDVPEVTEAEGKVTKYKIQAMKWGMYVTCLRSAQGSDDSTGLIPFWTKRNPDYGSMMKTINCRDDSLLENRGMWNTMKQKKRCIVLCEGFYEWLKKNGGKEKIPHFVKRKDGQLMCLAGLWDCAQYEGKLRSSPGTARCTKQWLGSEEKLYTYTIITTSPNDQLKFLHDRMPVILENGSEDIRTWLDPNRAEWSRELQSLLKPYKGELDCYPVSKDVGKVGNNSATFIIPVASTENKNNIANFFESAKKSAKGNADKKEMDEVKDAALKSPEVKHEAEEKRATVDQNGTEDNAPIPIPKSEEMNSRPSLKREHSDSNDVATTSPSKAAKKSKTTKKADPPPEKPSSSVSTRKTRSATSNGSKRSPVKNINSGQRITNFFN